MLFSQDTPIDKLLSTDSKHKNTASEVATISLQNKLSRLTTGAELKVTTRIQLYSRTNLPACTGLARVIGVWSTHTLNLSLFPSPSHTHTNTQTGPLGRINICWDCTLFQQCKIYSRRGGFTLVFQATHQCNPITNPRQTALTWALLLLYGP